MAKVRTAIHLLRTGDRQGLKAAVTRAFLPAAVFRANELAIVRLTSRPRLPRPLERVTIRWATPDDEPSLLAIRPRREGYGVNFEAGALCLIGEVGGEPASFNFFDVGHWHVSRTNAYRFRLAPGAVWAWGFEVMPRHRMSGIFVKHWAVAMDLLAERGYDTVYGAVQTDNPASLHSHMRMGFQEVFRYRVLRIAGITRHAVCPGGANNDHAPLEKGWGRWSGSDPARSPSPSDH